MNWRNHILEVYQILPTVFWFIIGIAWLLLSIQGMGKSAALLESAGVDYLQLCLGVICLVLSGLLAIKYFRDGRSDTYRL